MSTLIAGAAAVVLSALSSGCAGPTPPASTSSGLSPVAAAANHPRLVTRARPGGSAALGAITYALDQLAPAPAGVPGAPVLLAVIRASTTGPPTSLHTRDLSLVDDHGDRWGAVPIPTYVAIDTLENSPIEPGRGAAGTVAFRLPPGRSGVAVAIRSGGEEVVLDAAP